MFVCFGAPNGELCCPGNDDPNGVDALLLNGEGAGATFPKGDEFGIPKGDGFDDGGPPKGDGVAAAPEPPHDPPKGDGEEVFPPPPPPPPNGDWLEDSVPKFDEDTLEFVPPPKGIVLAFEDPNGTLLTEDEPKGVWLELPADGCICAVEFVNGDGAAALKLGVAPKGEGFGGRFPSPKGEGREVTAPPTKGDGLASPPLADIGLAAPPPPKVDGVGAGAVPLPKVE